MQDHAPKSYLKGSLCSRVFRFFRRLPAQSPGAKAATLKPKIVQRDGLAYVDFGVTK